MVHKPTLKRPVLLVASAVGATSCFYARDTMHINFYKLIKNIVLPPPRISHTRYISLLSLIPLRSLFSQTSSFPFLWIWTVLKAIKLSTLSLYFPIKLFPFKFVRQMRFFAPPIRLVCNEICLIPYRIIGAHALMDLFSKVLNWMWSRGI